MPRQELWGVSFNRCPNSDVKTLLKLIGLREKLKFHHYYTPERTLIRLCPQAIMANMAMASMALAIMNMALGIMAMDHIALKPTLRSVLLARLFFGNNRTPNFRIVTTIQRSAVMLVMIQGVVGTATIASNRSLL